MSILEERKAITREKRLYTLSHFNGNLEALIDETSASEIKQRVRTFAQAYEDEIIYAFRVLSTIKDAAIIVNGAIGCGAIGLGVNRISNYNWYSTNLVEKDTILGGDDKLQEAIVRANEQLSPRAIFIIGTPVVAINNDDVSSIIRELEDELGVTIINIYTDGFKTKTPINGFDIVTHSLIKNIVNHEPTESKGDFINLISFSESPQDISSIVTILKDLKIEYNLIPNFSSIGDIKKASSARASVVLNAEEGGYLAENLEELFQVKYIKSEAPVGYRGIKKFIDNIAKEFGIEDEATRYIQKKEEEINNSVENILADKTVFIDAPLSVINGLIGLVELFGGTTNGIAVPFVDLSNRKNLEKLDGISKGTPVIVGVGQYSEKSNALYKVNSDFYLSTFNGSSFAINEGSIPVSLNYISRIGYEGILAVFKAFRKATLIKDNNTQVFTSKYKESYRKKSGNWYVKQEVK